MALDAPVRSPDRVTAKVGLTRRRLAGMAGMAGMAVGAVFAAACGAGGGGAQQSVPNAAADTPAKRIRSRGSARVV